MEMKKLTKKDKIVYALIVLMGVAAFIISTIWLCKTEEAEAAITTDGVYYPDLWTEVDWGEYESFKVTLRDSYTDFIVYQDPFNSNVYAYHFVSSKSVLFPTGEVYGKTKYSCYVNYFVQVNNSVVTRVDLKNSDVDVYYYYESKWVNMIGSTYDYRCSGLESLPHSNMQYSFISEAYDRSGFIPSPTKARHVGLGLWKFDYMYSLGTIDGSGNTVLEHPRVSYRIAVPSVVLVQSWVDSGKTTFSEDEIVQWRKTGSHRKIEVMDYYSPLTCDKGYFQLNLKQAILDSWSLLYGDISEDMISQVIKFAYPDVCVTSAYYDDYGTHVYGPIGVFYFESFSSDAREVYSTEDFYLYGTGHKGSIASYIAAVEKVEDNEDEVQDWMDSEEYKAALEENESLKQQVTILEDKLASVGSSDGNLWDTFDGVVESLKKASDGFVNIGKVIGNVFSFLPVEVSAMMIFVLTAVLVIAIYNAVRGR